VQSGDTVLQSSDSLRQDGRADEKVAADSLQQVDTPPPPPREGELTTSDSLTAAADSAAHKPRWTPVAIPLDTVNARLALAENELGALFFNTLEVNDSAAYWFTRLLTEYPGSPYVPRALYIMAQIARQDSQPAVADSLYRVLADSFATTEFGGAARKFLGYEHTADSSDVMEGLYRTAEETLEAGRPAEAVEQFKALAASHPSSNVAAKAEYASGWIYEQILAMPESAEVYYRRVAEHFTGSPYALAAKPKIDAVDQYKREQAALEKARTDSLARAEAPKSDTTSAQAPPPSVIPPDSTEATPPTVVPEEKPGEIRDELPPEVVPDTAGTGVEEPPPDPGEQGEPAPPPPENPDPGNPELRQR
jgi:hypothetical protein